MNAIRQNCPQDHRRGVPRPQRVNPGTLETAAGLMKALGEVSRLRVGARLTQGKRA